MILGNAKLLKSGFFSIQLSMRFKELVTLGVLSLRLCLYLEEIMFWIAFDNWRSIFLLWKAKQRTQCFGFWKRSGNWKYPPIGDWTCSGRLQNPREPAGTWQWLPHIADRAIYDTLCVRDARQLCSRITSSSLTRLRALRHPLSDQRK